MPAPTFTEQDSQNLIALAQNAPLRNLREAEQVSNLLQRFAAWYEHVSSELAKPSRKARQETPAGQPQDPAA